MGIKVTKFGGSSLADAAQFARVAQIIRADADRRFVVASAPGKRYDGDTKVTDLLYRCHELVRAGRSFDDEFAQICERYNSIIHGLSLSFDITGALNEIRDTIARRAGADYAASRGEYLNGMLLAKYLGYDFIDAETVVFFRDNGSFDAETTQRVLSEELARHSHAVIPGFYGVMPNGTIKTFSRGGSDITGSLVARAIGADLYENWTDVSGCLMADPRIVPDPLPIKTITYRELRELSYMGASVLHEDAVFPVRQAGIPINIRNTNAPSEPGTMIVSTVAEDMPAHVITGVAGRGGFSVIGVEKDSMNAEVGFGRHILDVLEDNNIAFEHLPSGVDSLGVVVSTASLRDAATRERIIASITKRVHPDRLYMEDGLALIAVVGRGMLRRCGIAARVFCALADEGINIRVIDQGVSELNIILGVDEGDLHAAIRAIYRAFVTE